MTHIGQFENRVARWLVACFGETLAYDRTERNHRFLEEALELVQSMGCTASEAHQLVEYVFGRPAGDPVQEVGGVMNTLSALCIAARLDMESCGEAEMDRVEQPDIMARIRAKQAAKPKHSPLPGWSGRKSRRTPFLVNIGSLLLKVDGQACGAPLVDLAGGSVDGRPFRGRAIRLLGGRALFLLWAVRTHAGPAPSPTSNEGDR